MDKKNKMLNFVWGGASQKSEPNLLDLVERLEGEVNRLYEDNCYLHSELEATKTAMREILKMYEERNQQLTDALKMLRSDVPFEWKKAKEFECLTL